MWTVIAEGGGANLKRSSYQILRTMAAQIDPIEALAIRVPDPAPLAREEFMRLLDNLPESQREVIFMLKVSGMSLEEVAKATSSTVGAIKQKAHRAYERLRMILERERKAQ